MNLPHWIFGAVLGTSSVSPGGAAGIPGPRWDPGQTPERGLADGVTPSDDESDTDGVYGRLDGDMTASVGLGARLPFTDGSVGPSVQGTLHYYWTVGIYARYADSFRSIPSGQARRVAGAGLELRPAFLVRWSLDLEQGPAWLDLVTDSLHLSAGALWFQSEASDSDLGAELGLGLGVPLMNHAEGPWLEMRATLPVGTPRGEPAAWLAFAWHGVFASPWLGL